jgi:hypothetical protein
MLLKWQRITFQLVHSSYSPKNPDPPFSLQLFKKHQVPSPLTEAQDHFRYIMFIKQWLVASCESLEFDVRKLYVTVLNNYFTKNFNRRGYLMHKIFLSNKKYSMLISLTL